MLLSPAVRAMVTNPRASRPDKCAKYTSAEVRALKNPCQHCGCAYTELISLDGLHSDGSLNFACSVPRVPLPASVLVRGVNNCYRDLSSHCMRLLRYGSCYWHPRWPRFQRGKVCGIKQHSLFLKKKVIFI